LDGNRSPKALSAHQNLSNLRPQLHLAPQMDLELGAGAILQQEMQFQGSLMYICPPSTAQSGTLVL